MNLVRAWFGLVGVVALHPMACAIAVAETLRDLPDLLRDAIAAQMGDVASVIQAMRDER